MRSRFRILAALIGLATALASPALAQQYPPATPTPGPTATPSDDLCLQVEGETDAGVKANEVEVGGELHLEGVAGCASPNGDVSFTVESDPVALGAVQAAADGSFDATFTLPTSVAAGEHTVVAQVEGRGEVRQPLTVVAAQAADTNGVLPNTGAGIALMVMWGLILLAGGFLLVQAARSRFATAGAHGSQARSYEVPFVDTSRFVPYRSRISSRRHSHPDTPEHAGDGEPNRAERPAPTQWDAPRNDQLPD